MTFLASEAFVNSIEYCVIRDLGASGKPLGSQTQFYN